ncbi:arabinofuranan 3-O-arabinosyltransferase [Kitasatospora sp. MAP12-15]|uniref:glycosyltransferase 87 family protein n=1 Tax=unclassified Kitasatospora TaxID=2633591 RepID=UPI002473A8FD|nr:glycosyltransferase 87 family protein [Kitasatospora sp. MAP12-44]MDH6110929.1 arabinofuranan 3-O-arabinosyltransferase [Kitasatospora sp. MAP12-44]
MGIRTAATPDSGAWLRARASVPALAAAVLMFCVTVRNGRLSGIDMMDNSIVVKAAKTFVDGGSPYADKRFLYFPSSVLIAAPQAYLSEQLLKWLVPALTAGMVMAGWFFALRIFRVSVLSRLSVLGVLLICFLGSFRNLVQLGNWTAYSAMALPAALLLAHRSKWVWAGVVVGLAMATKPILVPLALLFLIARRPRAFAAAVVVPAAFAAVAAALMPQPGLFFTRTLPFLLHGQDAFARPYDASLGTLLPRLGVPDGVALAGAVALAVALLVGAWQRWRVGGDEALRLVESGAMLMLAALVVSKPSFDHYLFVILPVLMASVVRPGAAARSVWMGLVLIPRLAGFDFPQLNPVQNWAYSVAAVNVVFSLVLLHRAFFAGRRPARGGADPVIGAAAEPVEQPVGL